MKKFFEEAMKSLPRAIHEGRVKFHRRAYILTTKYREPFLNECEIYFTEVGDWENLMITYELQERYNEAASLARRLGDYEMQQVLLNKDEIKRKKSNSPLPVQDEA